MSEIKIGDRVKIVKAEPGDQHIIGLEGVVSRFGILFPLEVTLDEPVEIDGEVFNELMLFEDEVEIID